MYAFRTALLAGALAMSSGCYRWVPYEGAPLPVGTEVRVRVTDVQGDDLRRRYGTADPWVTGPLAAWNGDEVAVTMSTTVRRAGYAPTFLTDTVAVPAVHVAGVDVSVLDRRKTTFVAVGVVAAAVGLVFATRALGGEQELIDGTPVPDESWVVRIPLGIGGR